MFDKWLQRVLIIDLSSRSFRIEERPELFARWLGGSGVGIRLLEENCPRGADPMGPDNAAVFTVGPLVGLYPLASKTVAMFKSPHTGNLGESHAGGRSAVSIRMAGYGAIVVKGASSTPVYLVIQEDGVRFRDASALWGLSSSYTVGSVLRSRESGAGLRSIMRIGRAGETGVTYAGVVTETYRHFGRLGLGAVFGSKKLKGIVVVGNRRLPVTSSGLYRAVYDEIYGSATGSDLMKKYHDLGTAMNVHPLSESGGLPTRNLQSGTFESADRISGEHLAANFLGRRVACAHCPVACIHLAALRVPYPDDPYFYKTEMIGYDHELIYAIGSMLGIGDASAMLRLLDEVEVLGLDVMSAGVTLAWATEALERGVISLEDTGDLQLRWGDWETYGLALHKIVERSGDFYHALGRGVEYASAKYGGEDFALACGGLEMPGYHTGPGCYAGYLTGARHSHLDSAGYGLDQKLAAAGETVDPGDLAARLFQEESWRQVLTSLVICLFARGVYTGEVILRALEPLANDKLSYDLNQLGSDILRAKLAFKKREGFDEARMRFPERIFQTPSSTGSVDESYLRETVRRYFRLAN